MKKVVVGSENPMKIEVTTEAFNLVFPDETFEFVGCSVASGVPDQPFGSEETHTGAKNRSDACKKEYPDADYFVGLEGGIEKKDEVLWVVAWMCVQNRESVYGFGKTGSFLLPKEMSVLIDQGIELGIATDMVFGTENSKHKEGAIGCLTNGVVTRKDFYRDAVIFALIPFIQPELYKK